MDAVARTAECGQLFHSQGFAAPARLATLPVSIRLSGKASTNLPSAAQPAGRWEETRMSDQIADTERREIAEKYCREQLAVMDGSTEAGLKRIGTERFEKLVQDVMKALPAKRKRGA